MRWVTLSVTLVIVIGFLWGQCALCRASLESSGDAGLMAGLRWGILLLLTMPYLIVGTIALAIYRAYRSRRNWGWQPSEN